MVTLMPISTMLSRRWLGSGPGRGLAYRARSRSATCRGPTQTCHRPSTNQLKTCLDFSS